METLATRNTVPTRKRYRFLVSLVSDLEWTLLSFHLISVYVTKSLIHLASPERKQPKLIVNLGSFRDDTLRKCY